MIFTLNVLFVNFSLFSKRPRTNVIFKWSLPFSLYLLLVSSLFFPRNCNYVIVQGMSYDAWNSPSVTFFANKHDYTINKELRQEVTLFRLQKETSCLKVRKQKLRWSNAQTLFSNFSDYIQAAALFIFLTQVLVTDLHEKQFKSTCNP